MNREVKTKLNLIFVFILSLFLYAMGSNQGILTKIPNPDRLFKVKIVDTDENIITVSKFSIDGLTYLPVKLGKTDISLDFAKINKIDLYNQNKFLKIKVYFKNGDISYFVMNKNIYFVGKTKFGNLKIKAANLISIKFLQ
ncbi:MAG: hypothetical protein Q9M37_04480 [Desulfonauticus sp.]|nr:hypothetical protein [Desulfonauticus sp.]